MFAEISTDGEGLPDGSPTQEGGQQEQLMINEPAADGPKKSRSGLCVFSKCSGIFAGTENMEKPRRIYLLGMMGSGKSHWSSRLGRRLGLPHFDLDRLVEVEQGMTVREIFEQKGEGAFRKMEMAMLHDGIPAEEFILATGGGTPCFFDNMEFMKANGATIWLNPSLDELIRRIKKSPGTRPILAEAQTDEALSEKLQELLDRRKAWYGQADIVINDDYMDVTDMEALIGKADGRM